MTAPAYPEARSASPRQAPALALLLIDLGAAGVTIARAPGSPVRLRYWPEALPHLHPALYARLAECKRAVLLVLAAAELGAEPLGAYPDGGALDPAPGSLAAAEARHVYHERLGIAEALGMTTGIGSPAWCVAVGEALQSFAPACAFSQSGAY